LKMKDITVNAYAKINLSIDVIGKRPDGYHEVLMVMQQIDLFDKVTVKWIEDQSEKPDQKQETAPNPNQMRKGISINLSTNLPFLPDDHRNLAYRAASMMAETYCRNRAGEIQIKIEKRIPVSAGLAGGSSNAAAVLLGLNRIWELDLGLTSLMDLGVKLGADVPFCLAGQAALNENLCLQWDERAGTCAVASGIGEQLEQIKPLKCWVLLSKPPIAVSTAQVYGGMDLAAIKNRPNTMELVCGIKEHNYHKISKNMVNVLENYSLKEYSSIMYTKNKMVETGKPMKALMSGSGPTVFGLYTSRKKGKEAFERLKYMNKETFFIKTL
jgi:4-diphosphocytidyl-2-C-methyl-D-erythritol kinase